MPKTSAATKERKRAQYDVSTYKREKGVMRTLANRPARKRARRALRQEPAELRGRFSSGDLARP